MVEVNGGMVPPLGQGQGQGERIGYSNEEGEPGGSIDAGASLRAGANGNPGGKPRSPKNSVITVEKGKGCSATIYLHVHLQAGAGCTAEDMQETKDKLEDAAKKWDGKKCKCEPDPPPAGKRYKKDKDGKDKDGCTINFKLVFHDKPPPKGDGDKKVVNVKVNCGEYDPKKEPTPGLAQPRQWITLYAPNHGAEPSTPYYAHELGHHLFGTGDDPTKPKQWDPFGHNPDDRGFMRDTQVHRGLADSDEPTQDELCALVEKYELCDMRKCCELEDVPKEAKARDKKQTDSADATVFAARDD